MYERQEEAKNYNKNATTAIKITKILEEPVSINRQINRDSKDNEGKNGQYIDSIIKPKKCKIK